jgi:hypothetical protein
MFKQRDIISVNVTTGLTDYDKDAPRYVQADVQVGIWWHVVTFYTDNEVPTGTALEHKNNVHVLRTPLGCLTYERGPYL